MSVYTTPNECRLNQSLLYHRYMLHDYYYYYYYIFFWFLLERTRRLRCVNVCVYTDLQICIWLIDMYLLMVCKLERESSKKRFDKPMQRFNKPITPRIYFFNF